MRVINIELTQDILAKFKEIFLEYNQHTNLISKNDEKFLDEKHIFDSLSITDFLNKNKFENLLDIGTGGGFPSLPLAFCNPNIKILAVDSIKKKINFIDGIKEKYNLENLSTLATRMESLPSDYREFFFLTNRAPVISTI